jgi:ubiquinone/menaquinone biosynthesis C-methylase UbiE
MASPQGLFAGSLPEIYERLLVAPLFRPFAQDLLDRVGIAENDRLLDVACGTGVVARLAREGFGVRGRIVSVDASPGMIATARMVAPELEWREGDAARLPVGLDETFDVVTCHQGLQFFADTPAALGEMRRVLAPGGRLAAAAWLPADDIPLMRDLQRVAERHLGPIEDQRHSFGDADRMTRLLADAGYRAIRIERVTRTIRMSDGAVFPRLNTMALVGMSAAAKALTEEQRAQVVAAITNDSIDAATPYLRGGELVFDLVSNVAIARA